VGNLTGRLLVNGERATRRFVKQTAYVPQEDNFVPTMTTWEVMSFYAEVSHCGRGCVCSGPGVA
jgi:ABC-type multidrug transport system ATPase subunit